MIESKWTASAMGRKGGAAKTEKKRAASRENGKKGGRPARTVFCMHCGCAIDKSDRVKKKDGVYHKDCIERLNFLAQEVIT
jgi:hypothetical protein